MAAAREALQGGARCACDGTYGAVGANNITAELAHWELVFARHAHLRGQTDYCFPPNVAISAS
jgi:hypothetical protein